MGDSEKEGSGGLSSVLWLIRNGNVFSMDMRLKVDVSIAVVR